jgi:hypothetical protein
MVALPKKIYFKETHRGESALKKNWPRTELEQLAEMNYKKSFASVRVLFRELNFFAFSARI